MNIGFMWRSISFVFYGFDAFTENRNAPKQKPFSFTKTKKLNSMAEFTEDDLVFDDYETKTTSGDDPGYIGKKDRDRVNKNESYEVKDFCNAFLKKHNFKQKHSFQKVERLIRLPDASDIVMRDDLMKFVEKHWS